MYSKRSGEGGDGDGAVSKPVRTSGRLKRRPTIYRNMYYTHTRKIIRNRNRKNKAKSRTAASQIAKLLIPRNQPVRNSNNTSGTPNLRRSTRKRRISVNLEDYTDSSGSEDEDLMRPLYRNLRRRIANNVSHDEFSSPKRKNRVEAKQTPRREGLRPRRSNPVMIKQMDLDSEDEQETSENIAQDETENGNELDDADDGHNEAEGDAEDEDEDEDEDEGEGEGEGEGEDEVEEDGDDEEGEEEQDGRRRYDLRNRTDSRRLSMQEGKQRSRSHVGYYIKGWGPR